MAVIGLVIVAAAVEHAIPLSVVVVVLAGDTHVARLPDEIEMGNRAEPETLVALVDFHVVVAGGGLEATLVDVPCYQVLPALVE